MGSGSSGREGKGDDAVEPERAPTVGERLAGIDGDDLAVDDAVPVRHRVHAQLEGVTGDGLKVILHQPLLDERAFGERAPDLLGRMRKFLFYDYGTGIGSGIGGRHLSILSKT